MADSRRVFVQLARAGGASAKAVARDPPVMAFVLPTDAWAGVVNEFLMVRASPRAPRRPGPAANRCVRV